MQLSYDPFFQKNKIECKRFDFCDECEALKLDDNGKWTCSAGFEANLSDFDFEKFDFAKPTGEAS